MKINFVIIGRRRDPEDITSPRLPDFKDALDLADDNTLTAEEIDAMMEARLAAWAEGIIDPPTPPAPVLPPNPEAIEVAGQELLTAFLGGA